jgi:hypothetical protein
MELKDTLKERGNRYGDFKYVARVTEDLMDVISFAPQWENLTPVHKQAFHMIFSKIARSVCGDPMYTDNIHDIAGYAKLLEKYLIEQQGEN